MANEAIERIVDQQIASGRISKDMRDTYIRDWETGLGDQLLRGSDYTRKTQQLAEERRQFNAAVEKEKEKILQERQRLDQWRERAESELGKMPELTARLAAAEQALKDYKIYEEVNLPPVGNGNPALPKPFQLRQQQQETPSGLTREEAASYIRDLTILQGKANRIGIQHMKLFGEPLEEDLVTHYLTTGEDPEQYWRVKHNVEQRQRELTAKQEEAKEIAMREQIRSELMREFSTDPSRLAGTPSPTFGRQTPLFETYAASRAATHSQNHANDNPAPSADDFVPPEKRPEIQAARDRQASASRMFLENFDALGTPTTQRGQELFKKYGG
jgi:hypothetical protein